MSSPEVVFTEADHSYTVDGVPVPGVTRVLGILDKPALAPWAAKLTAEGIAQLVLDGVVAGLPASHQRLREKLEAQRITVGEGEDGLRTGLAQLLKRRLKRGKLDHYAVTEDSIVRGKAVHKALEDYINRQEVPVLSNFPEHHRGYVQALTRFLMEWKPDFAESEHPVGSAVHGFAGTRDTVCTAQAKNVGRVLLDAKTSKAVYADTMFPQIAAYELAGVECGGEPTERQGIVRLGSDGTYEVVFSPAPAEAQAVFLSTLATYKACEALRACAKAAA